MGNLNRPLSAAMWSRALLMWGILAIAALLLSGAALWMATFIQDNIEDELSAQQISFPMEDGLTDEEREIDGMTEHAGEQMTTGEQAKVYSEYILLHVNESAEEAGYPGATYATIGGIQRQLRTEVQAAQDAGDEQALEEAEAELAKVSALRNTMLTASNLRGNLLSAYGWSNVGLGVLVLGIGILVLAIVFALLFVFEWRRGHLPETAATGERDLPADEATPAS